jgi:hypothetical protein
VLSKTSHDQWLENPNKWLSSAINSAFRELDFDRWSQTAYGRTKCTMKFKQQRHDEGDSFRQ